MKKIKEFWMLDDIEDNGNDPADGIVGSDYVFRNLMEDNVYITLDSNCDDEFVSDLLDKGMVIGTKIEVLLNVPETPEEAEDLGLDWDENKTVSLIASANIVKEGEIYQQG